MPTNCPSCGKSNRDGAKFCNSCKTPLTIKKDDSIIVQINKTTENILEYIQNRIYESTGKPIEEIKEEITSLIEKNSSQVNESIKILRRNNEEFADFKTEIKSEIEIINQNINEINKTIKSTDNEQVINLLKEIKELFTKGFNSIDVKLNKIDSDVNKIEKLVVGIENKIKQELEKINQNIDEKNSESSKAIDQKFSELKQYFINELEKFEKYQKSQEDKQEKIFNELKKGNELMETLYQEMQWHNEPLYKKIFQKRSNKK